jgi:hypothetical protein
MLACLTTLSRLTTLTGCVVRVVASKADKESALQTLWRSATAWDIEESELRKFEKRTRECRVLGYFLTVRDVRS